MEIKQYLSTLLANYNIYSHSLHYYNHRTLFCKMVKNLNTFFIFLDKSLDQQVSFAVVSIKERSCLLIVATRQYPRQICMTSLKRIIFAVFFWTRSETDQFEKNN